MDHLWNRDPSGFTTHKCAGTPSVDNELTFTEWEVTDINGDGYPDVVFNSSPVSFDHTSDPEPTTSGGSNPNLWTVTEDNTTFELPVGTQIDVQFNVLGVQIDLGSQPFSGVFALRGDSCGVAQWTGDRAGSDQTLYCGIADVNGDGIPDRVISTSVYLGRGMLAQGGFFTPNALLTLPGPLSAQRNEQVTRCAPPATGNTTFTTRQTAGLRDLNGDGIPDYVASDASGNWSVRVGTGTKFLDPISVSVGNILGAAPPFALSEQTESCAGTSSTTTAGLYDIDGDGKPEVLGADGSVGTLTSTSVFPSAHDAGRLVRIDNGFGASTVINYGTAKQLATSSALEALHQVPFPEVVVSSMQTLSQSNHAILATVQYAYGGAQLVFDPVADRFLFPGYRRQVVLSRPEEAPRAAVATITDIYEPADPADPYGLGSAPVDAPLRYARYLRVGRVSDVTVLSGDLGANAAALIATDVTRDVHRIAGTHYEYDARVVGVSSNPSASETCSEMVFPYYYGGSIAYPSEDACRPRGFLFATSVQSSRGSPGAVAGSATTVNTRSEVLTIDDFGRATKVRQLGDDLEHSDDDLCIGTEYAGTDEGVLWAVSTRTVTNCGTTIYARDRFEYDDSDGGAVSTGLPKSHTVERYDETGAKRGEVREFDATFNPEGNPRTMTTKRGDGATRTVTVTYDPFGLVPVTITTEATDVPTLMIDLTRDPLTLNVTTVKDPNLTKHGTTFDGFDRPVISTVTPPSGHEGVLSFATYLGFDGGDPQGRHIISKVFTDAVPPANVNTATGRTATVYLDELGRVQLTEALLGTDYPTLTMRVDQAYDSLGRLLFASDPYPSSQDPATAYGTTRYFNADGTPSCFIRGNGKQSFTDATDETNEVYPTCFYHAFQDRMEWVNVRDSASLLASSPQDGVVKGSAFTATGRLVTRSTWQGTTRLEHAAFGHDRLGRQTSMTRYLDPINYDKPVTWTWHFDSLGQLLELDESENAAQFNTYSDWGELLETTRTVGGTVKRHPEVRRARPPAPRRAAERRRHRSRDRARLRIRHRGAGRAASDSRQRAWPPCEGDLADWLCDLQLRRPGPQQREGLH